MTSPITVKMQLERQSASFVNMIDEALSKDEVEAAVKKAIASFDLEREVERIVGMHLLERLHTLTRVAASRVDMPVEYDQTCDTLTICGVKYAGTRFRMLGGVLPVGKKFSLLKRE